ncbi:MAG: aminotransferase class III-fold pyridoxal phosphate-dependent enzyme, partial [Ruminococcaceae bacterium]|nr:aminotransferase class III-fold pyridoxal phosphate-dependent enzyme [Oscillospiraceae bacterium]
SFQHTSNLFYTEPCVRLAEMLCERTGMKKVFFANSGAEANECAIKAARKYHEDKADGRSTIITLKNSFHGRTVTTLAATGQDVFHKNFLPLTEGFVYADADDTEALIKLADDVKPAAIMMELIQGEGGVRALDKDFVKAVEAYCKVNDVLLVIDEVQTGNGRSGKLYAFMQYGISPDIVTTAKGLAGGLPLGAAMFNEKTEGVYGPGSHGSTFGGNPVCCAGAVNILGRIDEKLLEGVEKRSEYIRNSLTGKKGIKSVSGMGLMLGIETEKPAADILAVCREKGLLVLTAKTKVRLLPPLNIPFDLVEKAVDIIISVCAE